jgi:hypothetical protein
MNNNNMNITNLDPDNNFVLSTHQMADIRFALRIMLMNLRASESKFVFVPSSENGTRESEIKILEKLLDETEYNKVKLRNFLPRKST